jgi:hypothetical protein
MRSRGAVEDDGCLAARHLDRVGEGGCQRSQGVDRLADVAEGHGRADPEPDREIGVGLAFAQVGQHEQGLVADTATTAWPSSR